MKKKEEKRRVEKVDPSSLIPFCLALCCERVRVREREREEEEEEEKRRGGGGREKERERELANKV